ncbi:MarR family winged helix-turn-helix transcriptional regulator [Agrobacterium tumefaciens]|uniref:MarR family winged helix-turn-helix transcriptional regulator n=1 Tax=Agrobacterium tumefaciens TaxID=358 RepID=UPI00129AD4A6|nr:MarR family transcriptional regulator [Agrobacterium tumefaciens]MRH98871.1 MarR family transcriptional regulator [Agrobacterium tumefaciens]
MREIEEITYPHVGETRCNATAIRQAARHMTRFYDAAMAAIGLRGTQYTTLLYLSRQGPMTIGSLADAMVMDRTTVGHLVKPLERDGLLRIDSDPEDRRSRLVSVTEEGMQRVRDGYAAWEKAQEVFEASFGAEKAEGMRRTMAAVVATRLPLA